MECMMSFVQTTNLAAGVAAIHKGGQDAEGAKRRHSEPDCNLRQNEGG